MAMPYPIFRKQTFSRYPLSIHPIFQQKKRLTNQKNDDSESRSSKQYLDYKAMTAAEIKQAFSALK